MTEANFAALLFIAVCMGIWVTWWPDHCGSACERCRPKSKRKH